MEEGGPPEATPLAEELLAVAGCWVQDGHFYSGVRSHWKVVHAPAMATCHWFGKSGNDKYRAQGLLRLVTLICGTVIVDTCFHALSKSVKYAIPRTKPIKPHQLEQTSVPFGGRYQSQEGCNGAEHRGELYIFCSIFL